MLPKDADEIAKQFRPCHPDLLLFEQSDSGSTLMLLRCVYLKNLGLLLLFVLGNSFVCWCKVLQGVTESSIF